MTSTPRPARDELLALPPTLRDLLTLPDYRVYFCTRPVMPTVCELKYPWQVWGRKSNNAGWATKIFSDYSTAFQLVRELLKQPLRYDDICLVSRSVLHPCPYHLRNLWPFDYQWCARCRRPTVYREGLVPRGSKQSPIILTEDEPFRCYYCGARQVFACLYANPPVVRKKRV